MCSSAELHFDSKAPIYKYILIKPTGCAEAASSLLLHCLRVRLDSRRPRGSWTDRATCPEPPPTLLLARGTARPRGAAPQSKATLCPVLASAGGCCGQDGVVPPVAGCFVRLHALLTQLPWHRHRGGDKTVRRQLNTNNWSLTARNVTSESAPALRTYVPKYVSQHRTWKHIKGVFPPKMLIECFSCCPVWRRRRQLFRLRLPTVQLP